MDRRAGHSPTRDEAPLHLVGEREGMTDVTLVPMASHDLDAFIHEEIADWADERVRDGTWSRGEAVERAQTDLLTVVAWEHEAVTAERQRLWTAINLTGEHVGWLWVKLGPPGPWSTSAFLCQMTVARTFRRHGYGRSMLAALEAMLATEGITDLCLNVCESNLPAKCLYAGAGFLLAEQYPTMRQLRKRLRSEDRSAERLTSTAAT